MKKLTYLLFLAIGVTACSVESIDSTENLLTADAKIKVQSTVIIDSPEDILCVGETYAFSLTANTEKTTQVQHYNGNEWIQVYKSNDGVQGTAYFDVVILPGDNLFRTIIAGEGQKDYPVTFWGTVCTTCADSLVAELTCDVTRTLTITYTAEDAGEIVIQGGLTNGTTIINASSNVLSRNSGHAGVVNSRANVTRWEGSVSECGEVVTVYIEFTGGNGIGDWTVERNEVEVASTEEQSCN